MQDVEGDATQYVEELLAVEGQWQDIKKRIEKVKKNTPSGTEGSHP